MNFMAPMRSGGESGRLQGVLAFVVDAESETMLRRVAAQLALPNFDVRRGGVDIAIKYLKAERSPALLFIDVTGIDRVLDAVQALSDVCEPQLQVVVIGASNDVGLYRGLMRMGVADYLFKPMTAELLEAVIWRLMNGTERVDQGRLGKLVAVSGARGGTGASSIAANVASYLADKAARRVCVLDLDVSTGAQAMLLGTRPNAGLAEALEVPGRVDDLFLERATIAVSPRLDLLASEMPAGRVPMITAEGAEEADLESGVGRGVDDAGSAFGGAFFAGERVLAAAVAHDDLAVVAGRIRRRRARAALLEARGMLAISNQVPR